MPQKKTTSIVLYKMRSGTTFKPLSLPRNHLSARLLDVKHAVARAEGLDFPSSADFTVQNATTCEVYDDESATLLWGTRVVVRRMESREGWKAMRCVAPTEPTPASPTKSVVDEAAEKPHAESEYGPRTAYHARYLAVDDPKSLRRGVAMLGLRI